MRLRISIVLMSLVVLLPGCPAGPTTGTAKPGSRRAPPPLSPGSLKVFVGGQGIKVAMVRLKSDRWLLRVTGTTSSIEGKVLECRHRRDGSARQYWLTRYNGAEARLLTMHLRSQASPFYRLSVPGEAYMQYIKLRYSEGFTRAVRPEELWTQHRAQLADGSIAKIQAFDVESRRKRQEHTLARYVRRANKRCGSNIKAVLEWSTLRKKTPKTMRLAGPCSAPLHGLKALCRYEVVRKIVRRHITELRCRLGPRTRFEMRGSVLHWTAQAFERNRDQQARRRIVEKLRWGSKKNLAQLVYHEQTTLCTDGKGSYVGLLPWRKPAKWTGNRRNLFFGTAKTLLQVPRAHNRGDGYFYDPRHKNRLRRETRSSTDRRHYHRLDVGRQGTQCSIICGSRRVPLRIVSPAAARKLLAGARWGTPPKRRKPYGLARDRRGMYYYVDRAAGKGARDYRLYKGPLGKLTRMKMINIVSDTEGDVFSTRNGSLRLVLEKEHSYWVRNKRRAKLINVPIGENLPLIFNELGVYLAKPYGTPCDIF